MVAESIPPGPDHQSLLDERLLHQCAQCVVGRLFHQLLERGFKEVLAQHGGVLERSLLDLGSWSSLAAMAA